MEEYRARRTFGIRRSRPDWRSWLLGAEWSWLADALIVHVGPWRFKIWWKP